MAFSLASKNIKIRLSGKNETKKSKHKRYPATILPQKDSDWETQNTIKIRKLLSIGYTAYAGVVPVKLKKWVKQQIRVYIHHICTK